MAGILEYRMFPRAKQFNLTLDIASKKIKSMVFTSCYSGDGVTTCALLFAFSLRRNTDSSVILLSLVACREQSEATEDYLNSMFESSEILWDSIKLIEAADIYNLDLHVNINNAKLNIERFEAFIKLLGNYFDYVICDAPSVESDFPSQSIYSVFDGLIFIICADKTRLEITQASIEKLKIAGANVSGAIMNRRKYHIPENIYKFL